MALPASLRTLFVSGQVKASKSSNALISVSAIAIVTSAILTLWLLASVSSAIAVRGAQRWFGPLRRFRAIGPWAMFAAGEGRKGAYGLAYRDVVGAEAGTPWITIAVGHHWSWHVFLLDSRRSLADAIHNTGRELHRHLLKPVTCARDREITGAQLRLRNHVRRLVPLPVGAKREIVLIKQLGAGDSPASVVICQFAGQPDVEH